jgi:predicted PurR-regulated permease PerM
VYSTLGYLALAVGFAALTLAELRDARHRVQLRFERAQAERLLGISAEVAASIRRYFKVKSITSGIAGVSTGLLSLLFGIKFAAVWALLAFLFEYVPTIGSILAVVPPVAYAFIQFDGVAKPFAALGVFTIVQLFLGNYVDPRIEGRLLSISPLVVLVAIVFWAWLWGAPGSLLGIPIVVVITTVARHFARTRWVWAILTEPDESEESATSER